MQAIWIEIPVSDLERAKAFYEEVFGHAPTDVLEDGPRRITIIPGEPNVSLNQTAGFTSGPSGALPYFGVGEDLDAAIERLVTAGGEVIEAKAPRGELGYFALVADLDGNPLYLHGTR